MLTIKKVRAENEKRNNSSLNEDFRELPEYSSANKNHAAGIKPIPRYWNIVQVYLDSRLTNPISPEYVTAHITTQSMVRIKYLEKRTFRKSKAKYALYARKPERNAEKMSTDMYGNAAG